MTAFLAENWYWYKTRRCNDFMKSYRLFSLHQLRLKECECARSKPINLKALSICHMRTASLQDKYVWHLYIIRFSPPHQDEGLAL